MNTVTSKGLEQRGDVTTALPADAANDALCPMAAAPSPRRRVLRALPLVLFLAVIGVAYWRGWITTLDLEGVTRLHDRFHQLIAQHPVISLGGFTLIYVLVGAMCVPGAALLTAAGGLVFGTLAGTAATVIGATLGATILFLLARNACSEWIDKSQGEWVRKLRSGFTQDAFNYLLFLRLAPVFPFWFVNIAAAALGVPLRTFVIATFIGITPATLGFASAGAGVRHVVEAARAQYQACLAAGGDAACSFTIPPQAILSRDLILALVLLGVLALVPVIIKKWRRAHV